MRTATIKRQTKETQIEVSLNLDQQSGIQIDTGVGYFDHMLNLWAKHGRFGLVVKATGDLEVDAHHTVEEMRDLIGVDSLGFLSVGSLIEAINLPNVNGAPNGGLTVAYFTGNYPTPLYDYEEGYRKSLSEQEKLARKEVTV